MYHLRVALRERPRWRKKSLHLFLYIVRVGPIRKAKRKIHTSEIPKTKTKGQKQNKKPKIETQICQIKGENNKMVLGQEIVPIRYAQEFVSSNHDENRGGEPFTHQRKKIWCCPPGRLSERTCSRASHNPRGVLEGNAVHGDARR